MKRVVAIFLFFLLACEAVFEADLSNKKVVLVSPTSGVQLNKDSINFKWDPVESADTYTLQIVTPSFEKAKQILLDTVLSKTLYLNKNIPQGEYQWRVKAQNSEYETNFSVGSFKIYVENLSNRQVSLVSLIKNVKLDNNEVTFSWDSLNDAESYNLQIVSPSFKNVTKTILDTLLKKASFTKKIARGNYQWRVKAKNSNYETEYATEGFKVYIENLSDREVNLIAPVNMAELIEGSIKFDWDEVKDAKSYVLQVATPSFEKAKRLVLNTVLDKTTLTKNLIKGKYEWRVKAMDSKYETKYTINNFEIK